MANPAPVLARAHADNFSRGRKLPCTLGVREMGTWRNVQYDRQGHSFEMAAAAVLLDDVHRAEIAYIPTLTMLVFHL